MKNPKPKPIRRIPHKELLSIYEKWRKQGGILAIEEATLKFKILKKLNKDRPGLSLFTIIGNQNILGEKQPHAYSELLWPWTMSGLLQWHREDIIKPGFDVFKKAVKDYLHNRFDYGDDKSLKETSWHSFSSAYYAWAKSDGVLICDKHSNKMRVEDAIPKKPGMIGYYALLLICRKWQFVDDKIAKSFDYKQLIRSYPQVEKPSYEAVKVLVKNLDKHKIANNEVWFYDQAYSNDPFRLDEEDL